MFEARIKNNLACQQEVAIINQVISKESPTEKSVNKQYSDFSPDKSGSK